MGAKKPPLDLEARKKAGIQAAAEVKADTVRSFTRHKFTPEKISKELSLLAFSDMKDFIEVDTDGSVKAISFDRLKGGRTRVIKKIRERRRILSKADGDTVLESTFEFELYDKLGALELGAEIVGVKTNKVEIPQLDSALNIILHKPGDDGEHQEVTVVKPE
jgi:hypothetical protein